MKTRWKEPRTLVDQAEKIALRLTPREKHIVRNSPYDGTGTDWGRSRCAVELTRIGVLESNPQGRTFFRITQLGEEVLNFIGRNDDH